MLYRFYCKTIFFAFSYSNCTFKYIVHCTLYNVHVHSCTIMSKPPLIPLASYTFPLIYIPPPAQRHGRGVWKLWLAGHVQLPRAATLRRLRTQDRGTCGRPSMPSSANDRVRQQRYTTIRSIIVKRWVRPREERARRIRIVYVLFWIK